MLKNTDISTLSNIEQIKFFNAYMQAGLFDKAAFIKPELLTTINIKDITNLEDLMLYVKACTNYGSLNYEETINIVKQAKYQASQLTQSDYSINLTYELAILDILANTKTKFKHTEKLKTKNIDAIKAILKSA